MPTRAGYETSRRTGDNRITIEKETKMSEYQGYLIEKNPETGRWQISWKGKKQPVEFDKESQAEEWIDDQFPSHRF